MKLTVEQKKLVEEHLNLVPYIIGLILLAATTILPSMIYEMFN